MTRRSNGRTISLAEYAKYDGIGLAELVRDKKVSPTELVEAAIEGIDRLDPKLNAVCQRYDIEALEEAKVQHADGPFAGVPFLVKDLTLKIKGKKTEGGSRLSRGVVALHDSELMTRFRKSGVITIGKTTTPEFGAHIVTEPVYTGITRNPWSLNHTPGGSSGGSAACVAAGIVPMAHANDGLGSIRVPAGNCGLFGLKPTRQRTPSGPDFGELSGGRGIEFILSRSVRDSAAMLDATHGADPGAPHCAPPPARPYMMEITAKPRQLKIAFMTKTFQGNRVHPDCEAAVLKTTKLCEELGHIVEESTPDMDWQAYFEGVSVAAVATAAAGVAMTGEALGRTPSAETLEPFTLMVLERGLSIDILEFHKALAKFATIQRQMGQFHEQYDILITPLLSKPPVAIGELSGTPKSFEDGWNILANDEYSPFLGFCNVTGQPAASIPLYVNSDGLPIGTQIVAKLGNESAILSLSAQLEEVAPWADATPPNHVANK